MLIKKISISFSFHKKKLQQQNTASQYPMTLHFLREIFSVQNFEMTKKLFLENNNNTFFQRFQPIIVIIIKSIFQSSRSVVVCEFIQPKERF